MMSFMSWSEVIPGPRGRELRSVIVRALHEVYDENARRFAPDDLGDNNITFGVNVSQNLRFAIDRDTADFDGVAIERPRNSFVLRLQPRFTLHFYKAPPGVTDIETLRFDESEMKLELRHENTAQLSFDFGDAVSLSATIPPHVVIVHFGGPETSFQRAEVGSPFSTATGGCQWAWHERFDSQEADTDDGDGRARAPAPPAPQGAAGALGLRLREAADDETGQP
jgi:hypothetical protein